MRNDLDDVIDHWRQQDRRALVGAPEEEAPPQQAKPPEKKKVPPPKPSRAPLPKPSNPAQVPGLGRRWLAGPPKRRGS